MAIITRKGEREAGERKRNEKASKQACTKCQHSRFTVVRVVKLQGPGEASFSINCRIYQRAHMRVNLVDFRLLHGDSHGQRLSASFSPVSRWEMAEFRVLSPLASQRNKRVWGRQC
ncbi:hypothetical protein BDV30DRAFT_171910 [Aspergillus minisclerotigenes]|uniref:Uncharacterized protein n=1 Tax=Aspergillus minisclerotigenes TaxID=656917 RepID=A0A5N6IUC4_9EURO|nr:hypothetical protein BDV30DRAFT_171910 [Aspergillus minisclerotigenes]